MYYVLDCPHYAVPRIKLLEEFSGLLQSLGVYTNKETFIEIFSNVIELVSATSTTCTSMYDKLQCTNQQEPYICVTRWAILSKNIKHKYKNKPHT